jgi:Ca2+-binding RTX toxin-like protein
MTKYIVADVDISLFTLTSNVERSGTGAIGWETTTSWTLGKNPDGSFKEPDFSYSFSDERLSYKFQPQLYVVKVPQPDDAEPLVVPATGWNRILAEDLQSSLNVHGPTGDGSYSQTNVYYFARPTVTFSTIDIESAALDSPLLTYTLTQAEGHYSTSETVTGPGGYSANNSGISLGNKYTSHYQIVVQEVPSLFTADNDTVDFNRLTNDQLNVITPGSDLNHALNGDDNITFPSIANGTNSVVSFSSLPDAMDGGKGYDTAIINNSLFSKTGKSVTQYTLGDRDPSFYGANEHILVKKTVTLDGKLSSTELIYIKNFEQITFNNKIYNITKWASKTKLPEGINNGRSVSNPDNSQDYMAKTAPLKYNFNGNYHLASRVVQKLMVTEEVAGMKLTGIKPAIDDLKDIFQKVSDNVDNIKSEKLPALLDNISSEGMFVPRLQENSKSPSNHSWGTGIDLKVDGILDHAKDGYTHLALVKMMPYFHDAKWISGSAFKNSLLKSNEDSMHFEMSAERIAEIFDDVQGTGKEDKLTGTDKHEILEGYASVDILSGKGGSDTLDGGRGKDVLTGGADGDMFMFSETLFPRRMSTLLKTSSQAKPGISLMMRLD